MSYLYMIYSKIKFVKKTIFSSNRHFHVLNLTKQGGMAGAGQDDVAAYLHPSVGMS